MSHLAPVIASYAPAVVAASGARASYRFLESSPRRSGIRTHAGSGRGKLVVLRTDA